MGQVHGPLSPTYKTQMVSRFLLWSDPVSDVAAISGANQYMEDISLSLFFYLSVPLFFLSKLLNISKNIILKLTPQIK